MQLLKWRVKVTHHHARQHIFSRLWKTVADVPSHPAEGEPEGFSLGMLANRLTLFCRAGTDSHLCRKSGPSILLCTYIGRRLDRSALRSHTCIASDTGIQNAPRDMLYRKTRGIRHLRGKQITKEGKKRNKQTNTSTGLYLGTCFYVYDFLHLFTTFVEHQNQTNKLVF